MSRYLSVLTLTLMLAGCGGMIPEDSLKTQVLSTPVKPKKIKPHPEGEKQLAWKAALLLPLSGKETALGQEMKNAAELSLFENADDHLELLIKDTKSTPEGAAYAARNALEQGANIILGPVFAPEVRATLPYVQARRIPVVSFSSDQEIAGRDSYVMGFSPRAQMTRIVTFAKSKGVDRLVVLAPSNPYGSLAVSELKALSAAGKTTVVSFLTYTGKGENLADDVAALNALSFNGLFLPVGGEDLKTLLANLQAFSFNFSKVRLLGTGLWDTVETREQSFLRGAWYASVDLSQRLSFESRFQESYGSAPTPIAALAYDAVLLAATLVKSNKRNPFAKERLTRSEGFGGIAGSFWLKPQGTTERVLCILEMTSEGPRVISPASERTY